MANTRSRRSARIATSTVTRAISESLESEGTTNPKENATEAEKELAKKKETDDEMKSKKRKSPKTDKALSSSSSSEAAGKKKKTKKITKRSEKLPKSEELPTSESEDDEKKTKQKTTTKRKNKKVDHQRITEHDPPQLPKLWSDNNSSSSSHTFTVVSWNVAGLRAVLKNHPDALSNLARMCNADVLCLQETKLQEKHLDDPKLNNIRATLLKSEGYDGHYNCATTKLGYSGTAVFVKRYSSSSNNDNDKKVNKNKTKENKKQTKLGQFFTTKNEKKKANEELIDENEEKNVVDSFRIDEYFVNKLIPTNIEYTIGNSNEAHNKEGRTITIEYPLFTLVNVYVPNSGAKLERLSYRTNEWDTDFLSYMQEKQQKSNNHKKNKQQHPVIWLGDLNVAHKSKDVWNDGAKHLIKQAGTTNEERQSFTNQLCNGKYIDAFRYLHPNAQGYYSYWSQRAFNRPPNKGLRLDYFICSEDLFNDEMMVIVRDSFMLNDFMGSDHCPVVLQLEIKKE